MEDEVLKRAYILLLLIHGTFKLIYNLGSVQNVFHYFRAVCSAAKNIASLPKIRGVLPQCTAAVREFSDGLLIKVQLTQNADEF